MANIGGNITGTIQTGKAGKNALSESVTTWADFRAFPGWLGMQSGTSNYQTFHAKIEESTHVFLSDYFPDIDALADGKDDLRMIIKGFVYDVLYIDNPDEMNEQLEIYLRKVGAWDG